MSSGNNFYGSSAPTNRKSAPPPPPRRTNNNNSKLGARSNYQSNRAIPPSKKGPSSGNAPKLTTRTTGAATKLGTSSGSTTMRARKAASRPVGSYYNSTAATTMTNESTTASSFNASNPYAAPAPAATTSDDDTWDDWGTPTKPTASTAATSNPHASWAAPAPAAAPAASTNDWYASSSTASTGYTSTGFGNQQSQQQPMQPGQGFFQNNTAPQQQQQTMLSGAMDASAPTMSAPAANTTATTAPAGAPAGFDLSSFSTFIPSSIMQPQQPQGPTDAAYPSIEDEAPLLEELGINIQHMMLKGKAVVFPFSRFGGDQIDPHAICQESDLPGPVCLLLLLGGEMVLTGKLQFGYIYVYGLFGCIAMTFVVNLISPTESVSFWTVTSIMGYALLPVNILALVKIFVVNLIKLQTLGNILGGLTVVWSTLASTRLLELGCGLRDQRYLIMYPLLLFYSAFVMMTIL